MRLTPTCFAAAFVLEIEPIHDERGFFARTWCADEFRRHGLVDRIAQCSVSYNERKGTLRGLHFQAPPHEETKVVRCTAGEVFDVIVDVRPGSDTFGKWFGTRLSAANRCAMYIPSGFAHGFITLEDCTELEYLISVPHAPAHARGFRWNDPAVAIEWPLAPAVISARDAAYPSLAELAEH